MSTSTVGKALRAHREAKGWSRATLARESRTSEPAITRTELYGNSPRLATLRLWADALEIDVTDLLTYDAPAEAAS